MTAKILRLNHLTIMAYVGAFFLMFVVCVSISFATDTSDRQTVLLTANKAWNQYIEQMKQLRFCGESVNSFRYAPYCGPTKQSKEEITNNRGQFLYDTFNWASEWLSEANIGMNNSTLVNCFNDDYYFIISSNNEGNLQIQDVRQWKKKNPLTNKIDPTSFSEMRDEDNAVISLFLSTCTGLYVSAAYLPLLVKQEGFELQEVRKEENDRHEERVVLVFSYDPEKGEPFPILSGELTLMPDKYWLIEEAKCVLLSGDHSELKTWRNEYRDFDVGKGRSFPIFVKQTFSVSDKPENDNLKVSGEILHRIELLDKSPDKSRFRLTHYGFPEPIFDEPKWNMGRFLLFIIGGGAVLLAMWIMIVRKRREEANSIIDK